ncbi:Cupin 2, conserved barrel [Rubrobacter xylanophilus DSM 9941]|uniref:Cupin 2, conserved barrel n=2 Tax=Rubrobacter xylanophilus TaxID=49319 RepID=Q1ATU6_RUBXD|nr:Cupin 2, conserved barrel [Rubrobacter xylanophilus DSM 9941]
MNRSERQMVENAQVVKADSRPIKHLPGRTLRWLVDRSVGTTATAVLENLLPPDGFVPSHYHGVEEILVCIEGQGEFQVDGRTHKFSEDDIIIVPPRRMHGFRNVGDKHMRVLAIFSSADPDVTWQDSRYAANLWRSDSTLHGS